MAQFKERLDNMERRLGAELEEASDKRKDLNSGGGGDLN